MMETIATTKMYHVKPVFSMTSRLPRVKVMYEMKNIHESNGLASKMEQQVSRLLKAPHPEFAALESKQERILGQLAELKKIIANLSLMVKNSDQTLTTSQTVTTTQSATTTVTEREIKMDPITMDLVVKVNRNEIPYSLLPLKKIWRDTVFNVSCHSHSDKVTVKPTDEIITFQNNVQSNNEAQQKKIGLNVVNLILIWKNVDILEISVGLPNKCLLGEANLLRLLSRTLQSHNYEIDNTCGEPNAIDKILDVCYEMDQAKSNEVSNAAVAKFSDALKTGKTWLASENEATIADIAAWSVIQKHSLKKLPNNVSKWFEKCQKQFCY